MNRFTLLMVMLCLILSACYRVIAPPQLAEAVSISIVSNEARLVRQQSLLQHSIAENIHQDLGWHIHPTGPASLEISIGEEIIDGVAEDNLGITSRWEVSIEGQAVLKCAQGTWSHSFSSVGNYSNRADEHSALEIASDGVARDITAWLETLPLTR